MALDSAPNHSGAAAGDANSIAPGPPGPSPVFFGPKGLRAGWRILLAATIGLGITAVLGAVITLIKPVRNFYIETARQIQTQRTVAPSGEIANEGFVVVVVLGTVAIMSLIEKRSFSDYGLPWNQAFGKRFWQGVPLGFAMLSVLLAVIWALHGFSLDGLAVTGVVAAKYGLLWTIVFLLVAFFGDFTFRGYLQSALGDGIGFWPAAFILAVAFGAIHWTNKGEALFGCVMAGSFGLLEAFTLWRTGNLWLPIGMHLAWDWGETYFYGTPDSGLLATGHLLNSSFHGAKWLTGGTVGPEGSWLVYPTLVVWALVIHFLFPAKQSAAV
jgi:uncharacterized protein